MKTNVKNATVMAKYRALNAGQIQTVEICMRTAAMNATALYVWQTVQSNAMRVTAQDKCRGDKILNSKRKGHKNELRAKKALESEQNECGIKHYVEKAMMSRFGRARTKDEENGETSKSQDFFSVADLLAIGQDGNCFHMVQVKSNWAAPKVREEMRDFNLMPMVSTSKEVWVWKDRKDWKKFIYRGKIEQVEENVGDYLKDEKEDELTQLVQQNVRNIETG